MELDASRYPSVSVVIGSYNQSKFIKEAITSVASQSWENFDCIIVDDVSTDETVEVVTACLDSLNDKRFRFVKQAANGGQMSAMLAGLDNCTGEFVAFLDGDDFYHPDFLRAHVCVHLSNRGTAAISASDMKIVNEGGQILTGTFPPFLKTDPRDRGRDDAGIKPAKISEYDCVFADATYRGWIWSATSGMMFRRGTLELARPHNPEDIPLCADDYWSRVAHVIGGTVRIESTLGYYRLHDGNGWANNLFLGDLLQIGAVDKALEIAIEQAAAIRLCEVAKSLSRFDPEGKIALNVFRMLGYAKAFRLCGKSPQVYEVLWKHLPQKSSSQK